MLTKMAQGLFKYVKLFLRGSLKKALNLCILNSFHSGIDFLKRVRIFIIVAFDLGWLFILSVKLLVILLLDASAHKCGVVSALLLLRCPFIEEARADIIEF